MDFKIFNHNPSCAPVGAQALRGVPKCANTKGLLYGVLYFGSPFGLEIKTKILINIKMSMICEPPKLKSDKKKIRVATSGYPFSICPRDFSHGGRTER